MRSHRFILRSKLLLLFVLWLLQLCRSDDKVLARRTETNTACELNNTLKTTYYIKLNNICHKIELFVGGSIYRDATATDCTDSNNDWRRYVKFVEFSDNLAYYTSRTWYGVTYITEDKTVQKATGLWNLFDTTSRTFKINIIVPACDESTTAGEDDQAQIQDEAHATSTQALIMPSFTTTSSATTSSAVCVIDEQLDRTYYVKVDGMCHKIELFNEGFIWRDISATDCMNPNNGYRKWARFAGSDNDSALYQSNVWNGSVYVSLDNSLEEAVGSMDVFDKNDNIFTLKISVPECSLPDTAPTTQATGTCGIDDLSSDTFHVKVDDVCYKIQLFNRGFIWRDTGATDCMDPNNSYVKWTRFRSISDDLVHFSSSVWGGTVSFAEDSSLQQPGGLMEIYDMIDKNFSLKITLPYCIFPDTAAPTKSPSKAPSKSPVAQPSSSCDVENHMPSTYFFMLDDICHKIELFDGGFIFRDPNALTCDPNSSGYNWKTFARYTGTSEDGALFKNARWTGSVYFAEDSSLLNPAGLMETFDRTTYIFKIRISLPECDPAPVTEPPSLSPTSNMECGITLFQNKTFYVLAADFCWKIDFFETGHLSIDNENSECTENGASSSVIILSDFRDFSVTGAHFEKEGKWTATIGFKEVENVGKDYFEPDVQELDLVSGTLNMVLLVQHCAHPSAEPSSEPTLTPTIIPSGVPTELPYCFTGFFEGETIYYRADFVCLKIELFEDGGIWLDMGNTACTAETESPLIEKVSTLDNVTSKEYYYVPSSSDGWSGVIYFSQDFSLDSTRYITHEFDGTKKTMELEIQQQHCQGSEPSAAPSAMPSVFYDFCNHDLFLGRTYFMKILFFCVKIDLFPDGEFAIDPFNLDCTANSISSDLRPISYYKYSTKKFTIFDEGVLDSDGWNGRFYYVEDADVIEPQLHIVSFDDVSQTFDFEVVLPNCVPTLTD